MNDNQEHLDLGRLGDGPAHRPVEDRLVPGRRALRRRRAATGLASLAVVAVVGTTFALVSGPGDAPSGGSDGVAAGPEGPGADPAEDLCAVTGGGSAGAVEVAPSLGTTEVRPDPDPAPDAGTGSKGGNGGANDPGLPDAPTVDPAAVPDVVCCAFASTDPAAEPPLPPDPADPAGPADPGDQPVSSPSGKGTVPSPGTPPEDGVLVGDCGSGVTSQGSTSSGYGTADGVVGGTRVGPIGQDAGDELAFGQPADLSASGELVLADGVEVTDRVDNPLGLDAPDRSVAVEVVDQKDTTTWLLLSFVELGPSCGEWAFTAQPAEKGTSLQEWVDRTSLGSTAYADDAPTCASGTSSGSGYGAGPSVGGGGGSGGATSGSTGKP